MGAPFITVEQIPQQNMIYTRTAAPVHTRAGISPFAVPPAPPAERRPARLNLVNVLKKLLLGAEKHIPNVAKVLASIYCSEYGSVIQTECPLVSRTDLFTT